MPHTTQSAPTASGHLPIIGSSLNMLYDPLTYLTKEYQKHGSVFRVKMGLQNYVIMAGLEANQFLAKEGERVFSSESLFGGLARAMNTDVLLAMLDGTPHRHMRKLHRRGFSRSAGMEHLETMMEVAQEHLSKWDTEIAVFDSMRRLVVDQLGIITTGIRPGEYFDDILTYINNMLNVEAVKVMPRIMLKRPKFIKAHQRVIEFGKKVLEQHRQTASENPDLIDDILNGVRPDGDSFTEDDLISMAVGPFLAGMDTVASTLSFIVYALAKHPDIYQRLQVELSQETDFKNMPLLHAFVLEVLRLYPATPFTPRVVSQEFEFAGYTFPIGTEVMIAQCVTHLLPAYYDDPFTFSIDRQNNVPSNVFAPYSLGAHTCLGAGLAELQMMVTAATLIRHASFTFIQPDYTVKIHTLPLPNPGKKFKVRVNKLAVS